MLLDDLDAEVPLDAPARRVVSLVPSLTEALASVDQDVLVGVTDWCTHPPNLDVLRVRGTKNPDLRAIRGLRPDLVIANKEENRELDVRRLRESGVDVWVTKIETVPAAIASMERLFTQALGWDAPPWLVEARRLWCGASEPTRVVCATAVWRDPWMVVGRDTFTGDLLARAGLANAFAAAEGRYPTVEPREIEGSDAEMVLLPDEPYVFSESDGPEAFSRTECRLISGRLITWYGPSLVEARHALHSLRL